MKERDIFTAALDIADPAERAAYLDQACAGDAAVRQRVQMLLGTHSRAGDFLERPAAESIETNDSAVADATPIHAPDGRPGAAGGDVNALSFLAASTRPDSLGRLAHYEFLEVLGRGGFGIVFRAFDEKLQRVVAVKALAPQLAVHSSSRKRFLREAQSSARVRHENVVQVHAVEEQPVPYLVMEFVPGETLQQRLDRTGPVEATEVVQLGRQMAEGLAAAHAQNLIHRDIKPANILIETGPIPRVKITDFGLARAADDTSLTQSGVIAGSPMFMAPEQAHGETVDHRADLFSLGSVLYTMVSGRPPFRANSTLAVLKRVAEDMPQPIPEIVPEAPPWLCDIIAKLHAKKPEDRFQSAREVADTLGRCQAEWQRPGQVPNLQAQPKGEVDKLPPPQETTDAMPALRQPRNRTRRWPAAAAVFLALLGVLGFTEATGATHVCGTVIRLFSPEGTLVVEVDDPGVSVQIDGSDLIITGAGPKEIRLKPGSYTVEARKDAKVVMRELVAVTNNGKKVVRVSLEPAPEVKQKVVGARTTDPDRKAAEYVLSIGGYVRVEGNDRPYFSSSQLPEGSFRLRQVSFEPRRGKAASDAGLAVFADCKNLACLGLAECKNITDEGLAHFKGCTNLVEINVDGNPITDAGLAHFAECKKLTRLFLHNTQATDAGLARFKDCAGLELLALENTRITDSALAQIARYDNLAELWLSKTKVTANGVAGLRKALPNCKIKWDGDAMDPKTRLDPDRRAAEYVLSLGGVIQVDGSGGNIKAMAELPKIPFRLTSVDLSYKPVPVAASELAVFKDCKNLTQLTFAGQWVTDEGLAHFKGCMNLIYLNLHDNEQVTDAGLAHLKDCKKLIHIDLSNARKVGDAGLAHFKGCADLNLLILHGAQVSNAGLMHLKDFKNLTSLSLGNTQITDAGLAHLAVAGLDKLIILDLESTKVTAKGIDVLKMALPKCKIAWDGGLKDPKTRVDPDRRGAEYVLSIGGSVKIDDEARDISAAAELPNGAFRLTFVGLDQNMRVADTGLAVFKDCKNLKNLFLQNTKVLDAGLAHFKGCKSLTALNLHRTQVTDVGLEHFKDCVNLMELNLFDTQVTDAGLAHFKGRKALTQLNLQGTKVTDAGLAHFKDCNGLTNLNLHSTQVTDAGLAHLAGLDELAVLDLRGTKVTVKGIDMLKKALPKTKIAWDGGVIEP